MCSVAVLLQRAVVMCLEGSASVFTPACLGGGGFEYCERMLGVMKNKVHAPLAKHK